MADNNDRNNSKVKVNNSEDIRHQVHIANVPLSALKNRKNKCFLKVKKKYDYQKVVIKVTLDKSILQNKADIIESSVTISFNDEEVNIFTEKQHADKNITKKMGRFWIAYTPIEDDKLTIKVKSHFKQSFYNNVLLPRIKNKEEKEKQAKTRQEKEKYSHEDLHRRDFQFADKFPYHYSPNSDGNRSRREVFGGAFSGVSKSGGKRKGK
ncbi:hypothetical protein [Lentibacillus salicampi]|uniref:Uncharacterized protein n=1 Tax=Lentibacillus salicampi TaxID=175306 RepID=A0A4Y9A7K2_9BACI|nr:hypothetical protein [Lentibacillus salicampi]TFJ90664.1 hypothetical protein E4U82_19110 [Lentibacillus salicampi]